MAGTYGTSGSTTSSATRASADTYEESGSGWVLFSGTMIALVGTLNFIYGIAAIDDSKFYARGVTYVISDLNTWGWALTILGAIQLASSVGIWMQTAGARWVGIVTAALNGIVQMLLIPAFPLFSVTMLGLDVLVIYGLLAHGKRAHA